MFNEHSLREVVRGGLLPSRLELRTALSSRAPQRSDEDDVVIEGVIEVEGDASKKDPAYARDRRSRI